MVNAETAAVECAKRAHTLGAVLSRLSHLVKSDTYNKHQLSKTLAIAANVAFANQRDLEANSSFGRVAEPQGVGVIDLDREGCHAVL